MGSLHAAVLTIAGGFRDDTLRRLYLGTVGLLLFLFPFGLVFNITGLLIERHTWTSPVFICLIAVVTILSEMRARPFRIVTAEAVVLGSVLWVVEKVGIETGYPFGYYVYTETLGWDLLGVPFAIVCAWYATVINAWRLGRAVAFRMGSGSAAAVASVAALLTLALDLVLEPMAAFVRRYWTWQAGEVPLQNYVGWMVFTFLAVLVLQRKYGDGEHEQRQLAHGSLLVVALQWVLFAATGLSAGFFLPVVISLAVLVPLLGPAVRFR